jgi:hypothetical protein
MSDKDSIKGPGDWEALIRKEFVAAWEARSPVDITAYLYHIEDHFYLTKIGGQLYAKPNEKQRYKQMIPVLAGILSDALLEYSDDGKLLTDHHISQAKEKMKLSMNCTDIDI